MLFGVLTMRKPSILRTVKFLHWQHSYRGNHDSDKSSIGNTNTVFFFSEWVLDNIHSCKVTDGEGAACLNA